MSNENQVLVTALVDIEHDREKHIPGTKSATFLMPESSVEALIKAGAIERARVVDADALTVASAGATAIASATSVTFADVADHLDELAALRSQLTLVIAERDDLQTVLAEAQATRDGLAGQVEALQGQLEEANAKLAALASASVDAPQGGSEAGGESGAAGAADGAPGADAAAKGSAETSTDPAAAARTTRARK